MSFTSLSMLTVLSTLLLSCSSSGNNQMSAGDSGRMTQDRLHQIISTNAENVKIEGNVVEFYYDNVDLYCISDTAADRMRIISPIADVSELESEEIVIALAANFHSVLDPRYAIGDQVLYAAFVHPLSPLTEKQLISAIRQVATANRTFGTTYTSGELVFPGQ